MDKETKLVKKVRRLLRRLGCPRWLHRYGPKTYEFIEHLSALVVRWYARLSYRRTKTLLDLLGIRCPGKSSINRTSRKQDSGFWQRVLAATSGVAHLIALDATGFSRSSPSYHYLRRIDGQMPRVPVKVSAAYDTRRKKFCAASVRVLPASELRDAAKLLKRSWPRPSGAGKGKFSPKGCQVAAGRARPAAGGGPPRGLLGRPALPQPVFFLGFQTFGTEPIFPATLKEFLFLITKNSPAAVRPAFDAFVVVVPRLHVELFAHGCRILPRQAGGAQPLGGDADGVNQPLDGLVFQRVRANLFGDLRQDFWRDIPREGLALVPGHDQLVNRRHVDAIEAGAADRGARDAQVHFLHFSDFLEVPHNLLGRGATDDAVVHQQLLLALQHFRQGGELVLDAVVPRAALDERPSHVAVADQPLPQLYLQLERHRVPAGLRRAGHRHHDPFLAMDGQLLGFRKLLAEPDPGVVDRFLVDDRADVGEIHPLEHAPRLPGGGRELLDFDIAIVYVDQVARLKVMHFLHTAVAQGVAFRCHEEHALVVPPVHARPEPMGIAAHDDLAEGVHKRDVEAAVKLLRQPPEHLHHVRAGASLQFPGEEVHQDLGIVLVLDVVIHLLEEVLLELHVVREVAVPAEREPFPLPAVDALERLRQRLVLVARCRVAHMADALVARVVLEDLEALHPVGGAEHLVHGAEVLERGKDLRTGVVEGGESRGQLAAVLLVEQQLVEVEQRPVRGIPVLLDVHSGDAALMVRFLRHV